MTELLQLTREKEQVTREKEQVCSSLAAVPTCILYDHYTGKAIYCQLHMAKYIGTVSVNTIE